MGKENSKHKSKYRYATIIFLGTLIFELLLSITGKPMSGWLGIGGFILAAAILGWL